MAHTHNLNEETLSLEPVYQGHFLNVVREQVRLPNGKTGQREYIQHPGAVMIIPQLSDGRYLLEYQFRSPFHEIMVEFPAGKMESGEDPLYTAQRELEEETGYRAHEWTFLNAFYPLVSYTSETLYMYLARDLYPTQKHLDDGEFIETLHLSPNDAMEWLKSGKIRDGKTMIGLFWIAQLGHHICPSQ